MLLMTCGSNLYVLIMKLSYLAEHKISRYTPQVCVCVCVCTQMGVDDWGVCAKTLVTANA